MQQLKLHNKIYQIGRIDETEYSKEAYERLEKINTFKQLKSEGCSTKTAILALKVPQSTLYRWRQRYKILGMLGLEDESKRPDSLRKACWSQALVQKVTELRKANPMYGKAKICILLKRDHRITASESTVGRILVYLIKRDIIKPVSFYLKKKRVRSRVFNNHAQRWKRSMKARNPGEMFQIDHMSVSVIAGVQVKHFQGICPVTKMFVGQAYSCATSGIARQFLEFAMISLPFPIKSVQVDGGSEFMKDFEQACKEFGIPLYVLPPKSPELNGNVERTNGSSKYEFYMHYQGDYTLFSIRKALQKYAKKYNTYRPHQALQYLTPQQYYTSLSEA